MDAVCFYGSHHRRLFSGKCAYFWAQKCGEDRASISAARAGLIKNPKYIEMGRSRADHFDCLRIYPRATFFSTCNGISGPARADPFSLSPPPSPPTCASYPALSATSELTILLERTSDDDRTDDDVLRPRQRPVQAERRRSVVSPVGGGLSSGPDTSTAATAPPALVLRAACVRLRERERQRLRLPVLPAAPAACSHTAALPV